MQGLLYGLTTRPDLIHTPQNHSEERGQSCRSIEVTWCCGTFECFQLSMQDVVSGVIGKAWLFRHFVCFSSDRGLEVHGSNLWMHTIFRV